MDIPSYSKIYNLGHKALADLMKGPVLVEEKVDGSQFSAAKLNGELHLRSKNKQLVIEAPDKMFEEGVQSFLRIKDKMKEGLIYRAEYIKKPKHNCLAYDRIPKNHIIIYDIDEGGQNYLNYNLKAEEAERLGFEVVPRLYEGKVRDLEQLKSFMELTSILGGQKIEGFVIKNYSQFNTDGKTLMGKHVSEAFKEVNAKNWKKENKSSKDIVRNLIEAYRTKARWNKAIIHLEEEGVLESSPRDIGNLIKEVRKDIEEECKEEIKEALWSWAKDAILRGSIAGLPEYYKEKLMEKQF